MSKAIPRGWFAIGIWQPKCEMNMGTLWRSAHLFGAKFVFTVVSYHRMRVSLSGDGQEEVDIIAKQAMEDGELPDAEATDRRVDKAWISGYFKDAPDGD